jgi:hypothetical protein
MPKNKKSNYDFIAENYVSDSIGNNIFARELFEKYTPCKVKYMAVSKCKLYIKNKLDRAVKDIKYSKKDFDDAVSQHMVMDIWGAMCPLEKNNVDSVPSNLVTEIEKIVQFKTKGMKKQKKPKFGKVSVLSDDSEEESEAESEEAESEEAESEAESEEEEKPVSKSKKPKSKPIVKKKIQSTKQNIKNKKKATTKVETDTESDGSDGSDSD